jgi:CubicO group peptidase (beta-lactamase class C family)
MKYSSGGCREESPFVPAVEWVITCVNCRAQSAIAAAAGGLITTPTDYAKFLIELIQPSPADEFHVSKKSHGEMIRPQFPFQDFDGYSVSWGLLGCRMVRMSQHQLIAPGGSNPGFQCYSAVSPLRKCGFVIMTNADSGLKLLTRLTPSVLGGS